jgi:hypothetical protein
MKSKDELQSLPGIGPRMSAALRALEINRVRDLVGQNPRVMYETLKAKRPEFSDRCVLYVFRCAVWAAENPGDGDPVLRAWHNWKDRLSEAESANSRKGE